MNKPFLVGITGGIGSGKSIISEIFKILGIAVYDADSRAKSLMTEDKELISSIQENFGQEAYLDGSLNREYLAKRVFSDSIQTKKINELVHPVVAHDFNIWVQNQKGVYILKEAALLVESGSYKELDKLIAVTAPEELRITRIKNRDPQRSSDQIRNIIERQMDQQELASLADEVIVNDSVQLVVPQVLEIHNKIKKTIR